MESVPDASSSERDRSRSIPTVACREGGNAGRRGFPIRTSSLRRRRCTWPVIRCLLGQRNRPEDPCRGGLGESRGQRLRSSSILFRILHTVRWNWVTPTDAKLVQAPIRAGLKLDSYQIEPLRKALQLRLFNLSIADVTGLGKTSKAGLIARELLLRNRVETIVVSPLPDRSAEGRIRPEVWAGLRNPRQAEPEPADGLPAVRSVGPGGAAGGEQRSLTLFPKSNRCRIRAL